VDEAENIHPVNSLTAYSILSFQMNEPLKTLTHSSYTIGWICALRIELVAARAMLDEEHAALPEADSLDTNSYQLGRVGSHNVVIACLPAESTGNVSAAIVAQHMLRSFKSVRFGLLVGIGGGAPFYGPGERTCGEDHERGSESEDEDEDSENCRDIRLGDVVVSLHSKSFEAVVQYDFGKSVQGREFVRTGKLNKPPTKIRTALVNLQAQHDMNGHKITEMISKMITAHPRLGTKFWRPHEKDDKLFKSDFLHLEGKSTCNKCCGDDNKNLVRRKERDEATPVVHYGTIGSADQVMKDAVLRDTWARKEGIICFEMEAAGT